MTSRKPGLGAIYLGGSQASFQVWAPAAEHVELMLLDGPGRAVPLERGTRGYHRAVVEGIVPGALYRYRLTRPDGTVLERPDPVSRSQPQGIHGPSQLVDTAFDWHDGGWRGLPLEQYVIYELHVGAFTAEGSFDAVLPHLPALRELGVTALELMPVAQFPGDRNWGYDGVYPYAAQHSYGGPAGLQRLVDGCHREGLAAILDVVYNHVGPEGNYLPDFGPYFTDRYRTPWGKAINYSQAGTDEVRRYFIENSLYWARDLHIDGFRLDAIDTILDPTAQPFLAQLTAALQALSVQLNRPVWVLAESDWNDTRVLRPRAEGGFEIHAQWNDDFHHALRALLTHERRGYYQDFGRLEHLERAYRDGYVYSGQYSHSRGRRHGNSPRAVEGRQLVVFAQNHDQIGNRLMGDRLTQVLSFDELKLIAAAVLLSPFLPLLFMGEEYGETAPFPYFVSHSNPRLVEAVRNGRRAQFAEFAWQGEPPDPQSEETFLSAQLNHCLREQGQHRTLWQFYQELLRLRREHPVLATLSKEDLEVTALPLQDVLCLHRWTEGQEALLALSFSVTPQEVALALPEGAWHKALDSADPRWDGGGSSASDSLACGGIASLSLQPKSAVLYLKTNDTW